VGSVAFAGFTGSATTGVGYDLDTGEYGFIEQSTSVSVDLNFLSEVGEAVAEGDIYASIKATLDFTFSNADGSDVDTGWTWSSDGDADVITPLIATLDFDHAKIFAENWSVGIMGSVDAPNFAASAIDSKDFGSHTNSLGFDVDDYTAYADVDPSEWIGKAAGVEVAYADYVLGVGFEGDAKDSAEASWPTYDERFMQLTGSLTTPEYALADGITAQFGVAGKFKNTEQEIKADGGVGTRRGTYEYWVDTTDYADLTELETDMEWDAGSAVIVAGDDTTWNDDEYKLISFTEEVAVDAVVAGEQDLGASASAKVAYASDMLNASLNADLVYDQGEAIFDLALNAVYDMVTFDAYYANKVMYDGSLVDGDDAAYGDNLVSAKVAVDLDPIVVTVTGADLINAQDLSAEVAFSATEELTVTGRGGYVISGADAGAWNGGADVEYATDDYTVALGGTFRSTDRISLNASIESETMIPGATLKLAYAGDDITEADPDDYDNGLKGKVLASVEIAF
jgi:hypothetical protein